MKVLYAIQGTGNGHVARAREVIPHLKELCDLHIAISGNENEVALPHPVTHELQGLAFTFGKQGGIDYWDSFRQASLPRLIKEIREFPCEDYDLIINDFEPVTAWAAKRSETPTVSLSHQCAFLSDQTPRPEKRESFGEQLLKRYAPCDQNVGFHFEHYDEFIHTPIIRQEVRGLIPSEAGHTAVYLPAYDDLTLVQLFKSIPSSRWEVFSKRARCEYETENVVVRPISSEAYLRSLAACSGLLTGAGFEAPSEALYLGKKLMLVPMKGQYEQQCNAQALRRLGVPVISEVNQESLSKIAAWVTDGVVLQVDYADETGTIVKNIVADFEE